jgi:hypothetical protein
MSLGHRPRLGLNAAPLVLDTSFTAPQRELIPHALIEHWALDVGRSAFAALTIQHLCGRHFLPLDARRVAPEIFQAVKGPFVAMEDVHHHLEIVEHHPLTGGETINRHWANSVICFEPGFDFVCDRLQLRLGSSGTKHEEIRKG